MCEQDNTVYTRLLSSLKSEIGKIQNRGIPEYGSYTIKEWAEIWGVTPKTIRTWVKQYQIEVWGPSDDNYVITAEAFRAAFQVRTIATNGKET